MDGENYDDEEYQLEIEDGMAEMDQSPGNKNMVARFQQ